MTCDDNTEKLNAMLDGELPPAQVAALTQHLSTCPACARHLAELAALRAALAEEIPEEEVPPEFLAKISELLDRQAPHPSAQILPFKLRRAAPWLGTLTAVAAMLAVMFTPHHDNTKDLMSVRDAALRTSLTPSIASNIAAAPLAGFQLTAARADIVAGHPAKVLQYAEANQTITLCIWAANGEPRHGPRDAMYKGMAIEYWNDGSTEYWVASTAPAAVVEQFVSEVRANS